MNDFFTTHDFRQTAQRFLSDMTAHWRQHCTDEQFDEWELEARLGTVDATPYESEQMLVPIDSRQQRDRFDTSVEPAIFLGVFDHFCKTGEALEISAMAIDYVAEHKEQRGARTVYQSTSERSSAEKVPHNKPQNFKRRAGGLLDVRLSSTVERRLEPRIAPSEWPPLNTVKRERRSVVLEQAPCWRVDFTRSDGGMRHQIELELIWPSAYSRIYQRYHTYPQLVRVEFPEFFQHVVVEQLIKLLEIIERAVHIVQRC